MLVEICFVDTQSDVDKYNSIGAEAIADGIDIALCIVLL